MKKQKYVGKKYNIAPYVKYKVSTLRINFIHFYKLLKLQIMKPKEKKPETVFRIIDRNSGEPVGSYSRAYHDEFDFTSVDKARSANYYDMFQDKEKYKIAKYKVTYTLIDDDCE